MIKTFSSYAIWSCFAVGNLALAPLMEWTGPNEWGALLVFWCAGMILAQVGLLAIWFVLWPQRLLSRTACCVCVALILLAFWTLSYVCSELVDGYRSRRSVFEEVLMALCYLPAFQLAAQSPLWLLRAVLGWRIEGPCQSDVGLGRGGLTIRGILIGTAVVALSLTAPRVGYTIAAGEMDNKIWLGLGIGGLVIAVAGLVVLPPALLAVMRARSPWLGSLVFLIYVSTVTVSILCVAAVLGLTPGGADAWDIVGLLTIVLSAGVGICIALTEAHRRGFRLYWGRGQEPPQAGDQELSSLSHSSPLPHPLRASP
jgi:hypothetical protein